MESLEWLQKGHKNSEGAKKTRNGPYFSREKKKNAIFVHSPWLQPANVFLIFLKNLKIVVFAQVRQNATVRCGLGNDHVVQKKLILFAKTRSLP